MAERRSFSELMRGRFDSCTLARKMNESKGFLEKKSELERITEFAERRSINMFDLCVIYRMFKALNCSEAYARTMQWIYDHS